MNLRLHNLCKDEEALTASVTLSLDRKIKKIKKEDPRNPPAKVWEWKVDGKIYYYVTSDCCHQLNYMYDDSCNEVCAPDGGFTGAGDGKCPEFSGQIERTMIWQDERK